MDADQLRKLFPRASAAFLAANADLGALPAARPEPDPIPALDQGPKARRSRQRRLAVVVTLVSFRRGRLDPDSLAASTKAIQDAVAASLGVDDGDPRLRWQYEQVRTEGRTGVLVIVEIKGLPANAAGPP